MQRRHPLDRHITPLHWHLSKLLVHEYLCTQISCPGTQYHDCCSYTKRDTLLVASGLRGIHFYLVCLRVRDCDARGYQFPRAHPAEPHPGAEDRSCNYRKGKEEALVEIRS